MKDHDGLFFVDPDCCELTHFGPGTVVLAFILARINLRSVQEGNTMKRSLSLVLGLAALAMAAPQADARDGCGRGWFYNGRACVQEESGPRFYSDRQIYVPERPHYYRERAYGPPHPTMGSDGSISCNNPNYTWQDGACRPYRGPR